MVRDEKFGDEGESEGWVKVAIYVLNPNIWKEIIGFWLFANINKFSILEIEMQI